MDDFTLDGLDAAAVAAWLDRVTPHISDDDTLPMLTCVQITIGDGYLLAVATDRYTLAVSRLDVPTTGAPRGTIGVPGQWARDAAAYFGDVHWYSALTLTLTGTRLALAAGDDPDDTLATELASDLDYDRGVWRPGWRAIVAASLDAPADTRPATVAAEYLSRFVPCVSVGLDPAGTVTLAEDAGPVPYRVHVPTDHRPVVLLSPDLLGIIAVRRVEQQQTPAAAADDTDPRALWAPILTAREQVAA